MPNIIDSLVVMLGLDSSDLESKAPRASQSLDKVEKSGDRTERTVKRVSKSSKDAAGSVSDLAGSFTKLLAVVGGAVALKAFVTDAISSGAALDRLSKNLNLNVSTITSWSNATEQLGGSASALQGTLSMLSQEQTNLLIKGESHLIPYFSMMGIAMADASGKARNVTDELRDMATWAEGRDRRTAHNIFSQMGLDEGTINLLLKGRKELEITLSRQKEYGAQLEKFAPAAQRLQTGIVDLRQKFTLFGMSLLNEAEPSLEKLLGMFERFANWSIANREVIEDFLKVLAVGLGAIVVLTAPINLTVAAIVALGAAIALVWQDYQTWKRGGDSFIDWSKWQPDIDAAINGLHKLDSALKTVTDSYKSWYEAKTGHKFTLSGFIDDAKFAFTGDNSVYTRGGVSTPNAKLPLAQQARVYAEQVSKARGVPADIVYAQWQHETDNFTNRGATQLNNFAGVNVPGGKGQDYRKFDSPQAFTDYYINLLRPDGRYPEASKAKTPEDFAAALKAGGYYGDTESNYAAGLNRWLKADHSNYAESLKGIEGASTVAANAPQTAAPASTSNVDRSMSLQIDNIDIHTQATDAEGIGRSMYNSLDYLFASQSNFGMVP